MYSDPVWRILKFEPFFNPALHASSSHGCFIFSQNLSSNPLTQSIPRTLHSPSVLSFCHSFLVHGFNLPQSTTLRRFLFFLMIPSIKVDTSVRTFPPLLCSAQLTILFYHSSARYLDILLHTNRGTNSRFVSLHHRLHLLVRFQQDFPSCFRTKTWLHPICPCLVDSSTTTDSHCRLSTIVS